MKRMLALSLAMLLALTACGSGETATTGTASQTPTAAVAASDAQNSDLATSAGDADRVLVVWFSASGNTQTVGEILGAHLGADTYAITPEQPYTDDDLNWRDDSSRCVAEHEDPSIRPAITGTVENFADYDTILLGYPIWWGDAPMIVRTFLESYDFSGKTIIPFCTSSSSGFGASGENLVPFAPDAIWGTGVRFSSRPDEGDVTEWADGLGP